MIRAQNAAACVRRRSAEKADVVAEHVRGVRRAKADELVGQVLGERVLVEKRAKCRTMKVTEIGTLITIGSRAYNE